MKKLIFMMLALVCFTACTNDDENGLENNNGTMVPGEEESRAVELNDTTLTLYPDTDKDTVEIGAEKGWWIEEIATDEATVKPTAEEKQLMAEGGAYDATCDWISVKRAGSGIEVAVGMIDCAKRICRLTLATEDTTATVTVVQSDWITGTGTPIELEPNDMTMPAGGGTLCCTTNEKCTNWTILDITIDGKTYKCTLNEWIEWSYTSTFEKTCEWLTVKRDNDKLYVTAEPNTTGKERIFTVRLFAGDMHDVLNGKQEGELITGLTTPINLSPSNVTLPAGGGTQTCTTDEEAKWTIDYVKIDETQYNSTLQEKEECGRTHVFNKTYEWLTVKREGNKVIVTAEPNNTGRERTFEVYLFGGDTFSILRGTQEAALTGGGTSINLSPTSVTLPADGGMQTCTTADGVNWVINNIDVDGKMYYTTLQEKNECIDTGTFEKTYEWLTVKHDGNKLTVTTEPNTTGKERTFNIQLTAGNAGATLHGTQPNK